MTQKNTNQSPENHILYESHPKTFKNHPVLMALSFFFIIPGILYFLISPDSFSALMLMPGLLILVILWIKAKSTKISLTKEKTVLKTGILSKNENEVYHADVRNIKISQGIIQRFFKIGKVEISSAAQSDIEIFINGIPEPQKVRSIINENRLSNT